MSNNKVGSRTRQSKKTSYLGALSTARDTKRQSLRVSSCATSKYSLLETRPRLGRKESIYLVVKRQESALLEPCTLTKTSY